MKVISVLIVFFCMVTELCYSQDTITVYFDQNWNEISNKNEAFFYRKAYLDITGLWLVNDYYRSNNIQMTGHYTSKKLKSKQGHFTYFYENGLKLSEGQYLNDKIDGLWVDWFENGQKQSEGRYTANNREGTWTFWFDNGQKKSEGKYIDDNMEGIWKYWNEDGGKKTIGKFIKNQKDSLWNYYYTNGQLKCDEFYKDGVILYSIGYFENGNMKYKGNYENNKKQGEWIYLNIDGRIFIKGNYNKGLEEGEWIRFFSDGDMKINFSNGIFHAKQQLGGIIFNE